MFMHHHIHVCARHTTKLLLKNGEHLPHSGGKRLRIEHPERAAALTTYSKQHLSINFTLSHSNKNLTEVLRVL